MSVDPVVLRLSDAGFAMVPVLNMRGGDTGVLAWRRDVLDLVVVTAWSDDFAVGARVPHGRDWSRPFAPSVGRRHGPAPFADLVDLVLGGRHHLGDDPECVPSVEGAR